MAASYTCLFRNSFPWVVAVVSILAFAHCSDHIGFLTTFLTSSALILFPVIVCCCTKTSFREDSSRVFSENVSLKTELNPVNEPFRSNRTAENVAKLDEDILKHQLEDSVIQKGAQISDKNEEKKAIDYLLSSSDALSDSESLDHSSSSDEYSENDWIFRENLNQETICSDGSISDEESLIEIELPARNYVDISNKNQEKQQHSWYGFQQKWSDCSLESHFRQQTWMEMINEMNEENLIEIDICMGSIKCSRFEIEA